MKKLLLLEDDTALGRGIQLALQGPEAQVTLVNTLAQVRDTGPGIAEQEQPKVFQRFYRGAAHREEEGVERLRSYH